MSLFLLHGFTGDPTSWDGVRSLLDPARPVMAPALLGHGTDLRVETFEKEVDRLARLVEQSDFDGAHLCGYSLGARVGLGLLVRHRRLFSRATLIGVNPGLESDPARSERAGQDEAWASMLEQTGIETFVKAWEEQALFSTQTEEQRRAERIRRASKDPRALAHSVRVLGLAAMPNHWEALPSLSMPIHLIAGGEDRKFLAIAERMRALLPNGALTVIEGCGHNVPLERPEAIAEMLA